MKFEDFLMDKNEDKKKRLELQEEVDKLRTELEGEEELNKVLRCALDGPVLAQPSLSALLPPQIQALLAELAMVEEEIFWLERKVDELKMRLYQEKKETMQRKTKRLQQQQQRLQKQKPMISRSEKATVLSNDLKQRRRSQNYEVFGTGNMKSYRRDSESTGEINEGSSRRTCRIGNRYHINNEISDENPNIISEELVKCLIGIFLDLNQTAKDTEGSPTFPKLSLSCMNSKGFTAKSSFNCKAPLIPLSHNASNIDPYGVLLDFDGIERDVGPYKDFIQAFLEHGLPSTQDKLLALMNKGALNVGGIVLNTLAIEHFILRYPCESNYGSMDEKEMLLQHAYGLGYPEPNVTFALCRGNWSSPALRVYTSNEVVNELGRARTEYLEASVGVTNKKKILVPKLLQWHMQDFADNMESLLEWIYSQLPRSGPLKRSIMECLNRETKSTMTKLIEVQLYEFEFRYLLPL